MRMTFGFWASALFCVTLAAGCDDAGPVEGGETSGSTGADDTTTTTTGPAATTMSGTAVTTDPVTSTTTPDTTTTTTDDSSDDTTAGETTGSGCTLGELGCACDGKSCDEGLSCQDDVCAVAEACEGDDLEPNDDESFAAFIGEFNDDDDNGSSIAGVLSGPGDVDWYRYTGEDDSFSTVDPTRFIETSAGVRMCKFAECVNGLPNTEVTCPDAAEAAMSPTGRPGCCAPLGIEIDDVNCSGTADDSMDIYIRVDEAEAACVDYEITFHF